MISKIYYNNGEAPYVWCSKDQLLKVLERKTASTIFGKMSLINFGLYRKYWSFASLEPPNENIADIESVGIEELEKERRLIYVVCTRATENLFITYPINIYDKERGTILTKPSRFLEGLDEKLLEPWLVDEEEGKEF